MPTKNFKANMKKLASMPIGQGGYLTLVSGIKYILKINGQKDPEVSQKEDGSYRYVWEVELLKDPVGVKKYNHHTKVNFENYPEKLDKFNSLEAGKTYLFDVGKRATQQLASCLDANDPNLSVSFLRIGSGFKVKYEIEPYTPEIESVEEETEPKKTTKTKSKSGN